MTANDTQSQTSSKNTKRNDGLTQLPTSFTQVRELKAKLPVIIYLFLD